MNSKFSITHDDQTRKYIGKFTSIHIRWRGAFEPARLRLLPATVLRDWFYLDEPLQQLASVASAGGKYGIIVLPARPAT
jgi:hypothetical protein